MNRDIILKTLASGVLKASSALIAFIMTLVLTRNLSINESGLFLLVLSILSVAAIIFRLGLDNVILRNIGSDDKCQKARGTLITGVLWILTLVLPATLIIAVNADVIAIYIFHKPELERVIEISIWSLPPMTVFMLLSKAFQAMHNVFAAVLFNTLGISAFFILGVYFKILFYERTVTSEDCAFIYTFGAYCTLLASVLLWHIQCRGKWGSFAYKNTALLSSGINLWVASVAVLAVQWSSI